MTAQDRQKLAETVRAAFAAHYRTGSYADLGMAMQDVQNDLLAALAEPCQECETLREKLAEAERALPETFYAGLPLDQRIRNMSDIWNRAVKATNENDRLRQQLKADGHGNPSFHMANCPGCAALSETMPGDDSDPDYSAAYLGYRTQAAAWKQWCEKAEKARDDWKDRAERLEASHADLEKRYREAKDGR